MYSQNQHPNQQQPFQPPHHQQYAPPVNQYQPQMPLNQQQPPLPPNFYQPPPQQQNQQPQSKQTLPINTLYSFETENMEIFEFPSEPQLGDKQVEDDVAKIHKACKGFGCDKKALIEVFGNRTSHQTSQISKAYKAAHGVALIDLIKKETSGNLEGLLKSLIHTTLVLDCDQIHHSFGTLGTDEVAILKALLCKSNEDLSALKHHYKAIYEADLERELEKKVGGGHDVKRLFVSLMQCARVDGEPSAEDIASFPENIFSFFGTKSISFLRKLIFKHNEQSSVSVEDLIKKKFSGQAESLLLLMTKSIYNTPRYYATLLDDAMKGLGTDKKALNYLIAKCREPSLMGAVKIAYVDQFSKTLESKVKSETSGDYETLLVTIIERGKAVKSVRAAKPVAVDNGSAARATAEAQARAEAERAESARAMYSQNQHPNQQQPFQPPHHQQYAPPVNQYQPQMPLNQQQPPLPPNFYQQPPQQQYQQPQFQQPPPHQLQYQYPPMQQPQYQQQQLQYAPPSPNYSMPIPQNQGTQGLAIIDQRFIVQHQTTLIMSEDPISFSGDDFNISDSMGRPWFRLDSKAWSITEKRTLLDNNRAPILSMEKKLFSFGTKWQASQSNRMLFTVEPKILTLKPHLNIYLNDGDREPDFKVSGSFTANDFQIVDKRGGAKRVIATCSKQRPFQSAAAFINHMVGADTYYINIEPGIDAAFITAICLLLDEFYHDKK